MILVSSFADVVRQVSLVMTAPTFSSFVTMLTGWVFARRRVVTRMIEAADAGCDRTISHASNAGSDRTRLAIDRITRAYRAMALHC